MSEFTITSEEACEAYARIQERGREIRRLKSELSMARYVLRDKIRTEGYDRVLNEFIAEEHPDHPDWSLDQTRAYCEIQLCKVLKIKWKGDLRALKNQKPRRVSDV